MASPFEHGVLERDPLSGWSNLEFLHFAGSFTISKEFASLLLFKEVFLHPLGTSFSVLALSPN